MKKWATWLCADEKFGTTFSFLFKESPLPNTVLMYGTRMNCFDLLLPNRRIHITLQCPKSLTSKKSFHNSKMLVQGTKIYKAPSSSR